MGALTQPAAIRASHLPLDLSAPALRIKHVVVCTDFSEASSRAVEEAYRLCLAHEANLSVVFVLEHDDLSEWPDADRELALLASQRRQQLDVMTAKLNSAEVAVRPIYLDGHPASVILQALQDECPDLVVVGTHGKRGLDRLFLGSTAEAVVRNAQCPVLTVGPGCAPSSSRTQAGPVVYATDFHEGAEESIAYAAFLSQQNLAPLHCVHVLPKTFLKAQNHIVEAIMESALADLQASSGKAAFQPAYRTLFAADVSKAIVEYARKVNASAIVLGVTRRAMISTHMPAGRTSRILILAGCPVFTLAHERYVSPLLRQ